MLPPREVKRSPEAAASHHNVEANATPSELAPLAWVNWCKNVNGGCKNVAGGGDTVAATADERPD
jgi:hypothetical protein